MRITKNKHNKKTKIFIASFVGVLLLCGAASALFLPSSPFSINKRIEDRSENSVDYEKPSNDQKEAGEKAKEDFINKHDDTGPGTATAPSDSSFSTVTMTISSASQSNQNYQIRTIISALDNEGICTLTLSKSGQQPLVQEVGTQVLGSYSVCKGFDVAIGNLAKGQWQLVVAYKGPAGQGTAKQSIGVE